MLILAVAPGTVTTRVDTFLCQNWNDARLSDILLVTPGLTRQVDALVYGMNLHNGCIWRLWGSQIMRDPRVYAVGKKAGQITLLIWVQECQVP